MASLQSQTTHSCKPSHTDFTFNSNLLDQIKKNNIASISFYKTSNRLHNLHFVKIIVKQSAIVKNKITHPVINKATNKY